MYRIPYSHSKAEEHFKRYASSVKSKTQEYLDANKSSFQAEYTSVFLQKIVDSDVSRIESGSFLWDLLAGDFSLQKSLIKEIDRELDQKAKVNPDERSFFLAEVGKLFVDKFYEDRRFFSKEDHIEMVGVEVCPYCGRNYVFVVSHPTRTNPNTRVKPEIDHFLPKHKYPYLALNYYNLIPSCHSCNASPCKWTNDPIGADRSHEYLMHPYSFQADNILFSYEPTTSFLSDSDIIINMECSNPDLDKGYKEWLVLDKLYARHKRFVSRLYVQLQSIVSSEYKEYITGMKIPQSFFENATSKLFGYDLSDDEAPYIVFHKFRKDIYNEMKKEVMVK